MARQLLGCRKDDGGWAAGAAARVDHEAVGLVLGAPAPIEADAVVACLAGTLAIEASGLFLAAIAAVSRAVAAEICAGGALTTSPCALCKA